MVKLRDFLREMKTKKILIFSIFIITCSYTSFVKNKNLVEIKYIGIFLLIYLMIGKQIFMKKKILKNNLKIYMIFFMIFFILSVIQSTSISNLIQTCFYSIVLGIIYCNANKVVKNQFDIVAIGTGVLLGIIFATITDSTAFIAKGVGRLRVSGGFTHPNTFGAASMSIYICFCIFWITTKKNFTLKFLNFIILVINTYFIILSDSKNAKYAIIIFTFGIMFSSLSKKIKIPKRTFLTILLVIALIGGYYILNHFSIKDTESLVTRINSLKYVNYHDMKNLLFGEGLTGDSTEKYWGTEFSITSIIFKVGIIGLFFYIILFYKMFKRWYIIKDNNYLFIIFLATFLICSIGEAYISNITNIFSIVGYMLLSTLSVTKTNDFKTSLI